LLRSTNRETQPEKYERWMRWLVKMDTSKNEGGIEESFIRRVYGEEEIRSYDGYGYDMVSDFDIELFEKFLYDKDFSVAETAAFFLAYVCPKNFLELIPQAAKYYSEQNYSSLFEDVILQGCNLVIAELHEQYFGSMCRGMLTDAERGDEVATTEFFEQKKLWTPTLRLLKKNTKLYTAILDLLKMLGEYVLPEDEDPEDIGITVDPNQYQLDFPAN